MSTLHEWRFLLVPEGSVEAVERRFARAWEDAAAPDPRDEENALDSQETLRFPTKLDAAAIHARLATVRDGAAEKGMGDLVALLQGIESRTGPEIGKAVIKAMGMVSGRPGLEAISRTLQLVAVNLKNLK